MSARYVVHPMEQKFRDWDAEQKRKALEKMVQERLDEKRVYLVGRADLPPGLRAAQIVHVAMRFEADSVMCDPTVVLLEVPNETALHVLNSRASFQPDWDVARWTEPDRNFELTAIALHGPGVSEALKDLPLAFSVPTGMKQLDLPISSVVMRDPFFDKGDRGSFSGADARAVAEQEHCRYGGCSD